MFNPWFGTCSRSVATENVSQMVLRPCCISCASAWSCPDAQSGAWGFPSMGVPQ